MVKNFVLFPLFALLILCSCTQHDDDKPDTEANRAGFQNHCGFKPGSDVTGLYLFADEWGGDAAYWFAFYASPETVERIIKHLGVKKSATFNYKQGGNVDDFSWWDIAEQNKSDYYEFRDEEKEIIRQLWYRPETRKCHIALIYW